MTSNQLSKLDSLDNPLIGLSSEYYNTSVLNLRTSHIGGLPDELIIEIIRHLSPLDIFNFSQINPTMFYFIRNTSNLKKITSIYWTFISINTEQSPMEAFGLYLHLIQNLSILLSWHNILISQLSIF